MALTDTLLGALLGAGTGYMVGQTSDAKKVADPKIWTLVGAAGGHMLHQQMQKPNIDPNLVAENQMLRQGMAEMHQGHMATLAALDQQVDALLATHAAQQEELEHTHAAELAQVSQSPRRRAKTRQGNEQRAQPQRTAQIGGRQLVSAGRAVPVNGTRKPHTQRTPLALPDHAVTREIEDLDSVEARELDSVFGAPRSVGG